MPVIRIDMVQGKTKDQKRKIVEDIPQIMVQVAGAKAEDVHIIIVDHPMENLADGGQLLSDDLSRKRP